MGRTGWNGLGLLHHLWQACGTPSGEHYRTAGRCHGCLGGCPCGVVHAGTALLAPDVLLTSLGVALISSAIPISLELFALKHLPKNVFGTMTSMEPAVAALLALLLLGEVLSWSQCLAIGLIMLASMGCTLTAQSQTVKTKQPDTPLQQA